MINGKIIDNETMLADIAEFGESGFGIVEFGLDSFRGFPVEPVSLPLLAEKQFFFLPLEIL